MNNLDEHNFVFEIVEEEAAKPVKVKKNKKTGVVQNNDQEYDLVIPEVIEFEEIDECLILNNKKAKLYFDSTNNYAKDSNPIRFYNTEADWDLLRGLVVIKCMRKNKRNQKIVLDDIVEFRLLPKDWAEELCSYLFRNNINFIVYDNNTR